ncbi:hypothetical protein [Cupriavidus taiwanensis]|uniref:hypothetical protein n=2 Tax=Cupriavidus taiwanensis TaxID=164546 RepID=UPI0011AE2617|nr:hypothetical protein [Cupriavidus taiwanensis]
MSSEDREAPDPVTAYPIWLEWPWRIWCAMIWLAQRALPASRGDSKVKLEMREGILDSVIAGDAAFSVHEHMGLPVAALASLKWDYPEVMPRRAHIRATPVILRLVDGQDIHFFDYQINTVPVPGNLAYFETLSTGVSFELSAGTIRASFRHGASVSARARTPYRFMHLAGRSPLPRHGGPCWLAGTTAFLNSYKLQVCPWPPCSLRWEPC